MEKIIQKISALKHRITWLASLCSFLLVLIYAPVANAYPDDPIPTLDFGESKKSIVVRLHFFDLLGAQVESVEVVPGPSHGWKGDPPILHVKLLNLDDGVIDEFNAWHPLWSNYEDESGHDRGSILEEAPGNFPFPFSPDVATMTVTHVETQQEIISVDLIPALHDFCNDNPDDPDCVDIVNRPPICNANGPYSEECAGLTTDVTLDGTGSSDPDGDSLTYAWSGPFGTASGATPTVQFSGFGNFTVNLSVSDDFGGTATCSSPVAVVDTTPPVISCNAPVTITPPDAPISFHATATDICDEQLTVEITGYDCFMFTEKGKRIDKKDSCIVSIEGNTITINDSGGIDDIITWEVSASDSSGNSSTSTCSVSVVNPSQP